MSYIVAIAFPPVPANIAEAWVTINELVTEDRREKKPRPEIFQRLHDQLTAKFPCICSVPDDEIDDAVWSDGPLIKNFGHRVAVIGMSYPTEVLPFLIERANALGLVVLDWQTGIIHCPKTAPPIICT